MAAPETPAILPCVKNIDEVITTESFIAEEHKFVARTYHSIPVALVRGLGLYMWDVRNKKYMDFLAGYSAVNQGHCHPHIVAAAIDQMQTLTLTSRAFYNDQLGQSGRYLCHLFDYHRCMFMNSGSEAVESAIKLARRWGYDKKHISPDEAIIIAADGNFHGRTTTIVSFSSDHDTYNGFGPYTNGFVKIPYDDPQSLESILKQCGEKVAGFLVEPIQGEAGIVVPSENYLRKCHEICKQYNVLLICDEIQSGLGRAGSMLASEGVRPDIVCLGKALSGGVFPISAVLADSEIMNCIGFGQHGSTFGGSPLACRVLRAAVQVILDEDLCANSRKVGKLFRERLSNYKLKLVKEIRGRGLMNAIEIYPEYDAWKICEALAEAGILSKTTHVNNIRFTPPLVITETEMETACTTIKEVFEQFVGSREKK